MIINFVVAIAILGNCPFISLLEDLKIFLKDFDLWLPNIQSSLVGLSHMDYYR